MGQLYITLINIVPSSGVNYHSWYPPRLEAHRQPVDSFSLLVRPNVQQRFSVDI